MANVQIHDLTSNDITTVNASTRCVVVTSGSQTSEEGFSYEGRDDSGAERAALDALGVAGGLYAMSVSEWIANHSNRVAYVAEDGTNTWWPSQVCADDADLQSDYAR